MKPIFQLAALVTALVAVLPTGPLSPVAASADYQGFACNPQGLGEGLLFACIAADTAGDVDTCVGLNSGLTPEPCFQTGSGYPDPYPSTGYSCNPPPASPLSACVAVVPPNPSVAACVAAGAGLECPSGPQPGMVNPFPVAFMGQLVFTSTCGNGCYTYDMWADCQAGTAVNIASCALYSQGQLTLTAAGCSGASFTGTVNFYSYATENRSFRITGAVFADQVAIQGSGGQALEGIINLAEWCQTGRPPQNGYDSSYLTMYGYGTI